MHKWDRRRRIPPPGQPPIRWRDSVSDPTPGQLRGPSWRRSSYAHYVPAGLELSTSQRIVEAAPLLGDRGAITGWAAGYWLGAPLLGGSTVPLPLALGAAGKLRQRPGVESYRERLPADEVEQIRGVRCVTALRAGFDSARGKQGLRPAVAEVDMMLAAAIFTQEELSAYVEEHPGWRRVRQARRVLQLVDPRTASPPESRMRLAWMLDAGLPRPLVNPPIFDREGRLLGFADAFDPESATLLEYDSDNHRDLEYHTADNNREELFEDHGATVCRVTRLDLSRPRSLLVNRMQRARLRGLARDRKRDRWTLQPPPGWRDWWT
ncbi:MAG: hypothetical protein ACRDO2_05880 [Nocardioidaceae bacterium]